MNKLKSIPFLTAFCLLAMFIFNQTAQAKIRVPFGEMEVLEKVADLPDTEDFMVKEAYQDTRPVKVGGDKSTPAEFVDIGVRYSVYMIAYIPLWTTQGPELILYNENDKNTYYEVAQDKMDQILVTNNLQRSDLETTGFFTKFGGKLIALIVLALIAIGIKAYISEE